MGSILAERQGCVPFDVTGVDFKSSPGIDEFDARAFGIPGFGCDKTGGIKRCLALSCGSLCPGQLTGVAGFQFEIEHQ